MKFASTEIAKNILEKRYYRNGESTPYELLTRVAEFIASVEDTDEHSWRDKFFNIMQDGQFLPNSPALVNAGMGGGLFACFVLGMEDSLDSITQAKADAMAITKSGGGWGIGLSSLRPAGSPVSGSTHGVAGGPIGFWETFSHDMKTMTQGGFRDAACMATLSVDHKDVEKFIEAKSPLSSITKMLNLDRITRLPTIVASKLLKNEAIAAAAETYLSNFNISLLIPDDFMDQLDIPDTKDTVNVSAYLFDKIARSAWSNGEPGVLFIDTIRGRTKYDPELINATNPCGEQPLPPNGSCCLGSINLSAFVDADGSWNCTEFERVVRIAVRFLDNMVTLNEFPTEGTREWSHANRSIGLGVMGYADALIKMGIVYGSEDALKFAYDVTKEMYDVAESESKALYKEKGSGTIGDFDGRRNNALLSIAPTGTISLLAGCSAGIEPNFAPLTSRTDRTGEYEINHPLSHMNAFVTLQDIHWQAIVDTVSVVSENIDTSVSYTVNLPNSATVDDVKAVLKYAHKTKCNGCTVYRDGSRKSQVLSSVDQASDAETLKRPQSLEGKTYKYVGAVEGTSTNLYVTINSRNHEPWEVFVNTPHIRSLTELQLVTAVTRLSSLALRVGAPVEKIIDQLRKIEGQSVTSIPALIARALSEFHELPAGECEECGGDLKYQGGCATCVKCGFSRCG